MSLISANSLVLFQGDSITDCRRGREDPLAMGQGYASVVAARYLARYPRHGVRFLNRGISGNRAKDLRARWQEDCLDLKPDLVSILIGINDTWRRYDKNDPTTVEDFAADYEHILQQTRDSGARIVICEPFVLPVPENRRQWREDLDPRIAAIRELATRYAVAYVPFDGCFAQAHVAAGDPGYWAPDGVHPSPAGHSLMADAWWQAVVAD